MGITRPRPDGGVIITLLIGFLIQLHGIQSCKHVNLTVLFLANGSNKVLKNDRYLVWKFTIKLNKQSVQ